MTPYRKASVFLALFTTNERNGWLAPGLAQFLAALSNVAKERAVTLHLSAAMKPIDYARNCVVKEFLASRFDWLLSVSNDIAPPPNLIEMVDRADEEMRILVPKFWILVNGPMGNLRIAPGWEVLAGTHEKRGWCELSWAATEVMFIHRSVFERLGNQPWFRTTYDPDGRISNTEDIVFCQKARQAGFSVWGNPHFEADHFKTLSLSAVARSIAADPKIAKGVTP
jgi:GT2 family glycosyltransferase